MPTEQRTSEPFRRALLDLLREHDEYCTSIGNPNLHRFAAELKGVHYETLRRVLAGTRAPGRKLLEEAARVLKLRPDYFAEYRLMQARQRYDPEVVGFEQAIRNLREDMRE